MMPLDGCHLPATLRLQINQVAVESLMEGCAGVPKVWKKPPLPVFGSRDAVSRVDRVPIGPPFSQLGEIYVPIQIQY
jgi:hypothetical protein